MRSTTSFRLSRPFLAVLAAALLTSPEWAEERDLKMTIVYQLTSIEQVGDQIVIEAEGGGVSELLGKVSATASVTQAASGNPCSAYTAEFELSAAEGTIRLHSTGEVCSPPAQISGSWSVTGGTGAFYGASGSGAEEGEYSFTGDDPVIDHLEGKLVYRMSYDDCLAWNSTYARAVGDAKICIQHADPADQCTEYVASDLICGCPLYIDTGPQNKLALSTMETALRAFDNGGCSGYFICGASLCWSYWGSNCASLRGGLGYCRDW